MPRSTLRLLGLCSAIFAAGCGRSEIFPPLGAPSGGTTGGATTGGATTGGTTRGSTSGGSTSGGSTSGGSTSGGSTSGGSTSGGSTTGGSGGCQSGVQPNELQPCQSNADCACPLQCAPSQIPGRSLCEYGCKTLSDCPSLYTDCRRHHCEPNLCGVSFGGPQNGTIDGTCNVPGADGGSCVPVVLQGFTFGLCVQGGSAQLGCDPQATRSDLGLACVAGDVCSPLSGNQCAQLCDPTVNGPSCPPNSGCVGLSSSDPRLGVCMFAGTGGNSGGSGPSTGGGSSGGSSGGNSGGSGSSTGGSSTGGCGGGNEFAPCQTEQDCSCGLVCVNNNLGESACEHLCQNSAQCPTLYTVCSGISCTYDLCGASLGGPANGTLDGPCNAQGTNDGTCAPLPPDGGSQFGLCFQGGGATSSCSVSTTRPNLQTACGVGQICGPSFSGDVCYTLCNPNAPKCKAGSSCTVIDPQDPLYGVCYPP